MSPICLRITPAQYCHGFRTHYSVRFDGNAHEALRAIYVSAKQYEEAKPPPPKKRRLNNDIEDEDYIVLGRATFDLITADSETEQPHDATLSCPVPIDVDLSDELAFAIANDAKSHMTLSARNRKARTSVLFHISTNNRLETLKYMSCSTVGSTMTICRVTNVLMPPSLDHQSWKLQIEVKWRNGASPFHELRGKSAALQRACEDVYTLCMTSSIASNIANRTWSPKEFYQHVHVPPPDLDSDNALIVPGLNSVLYSFQQRAVRWLARREGVLIDSDGRTPPVVEVDDALPISFRYADTGLGEEVVVSDLFNEITNFSKPMPHIAPLRGGILAEEMGLGKTVELISLILLHRRTQPAMQVVDGYTDTQVTTCNATLIITPPTILEQWKNEIARHAPSLKVFHYTGLKHKTKDVEDVKRTLMEHDIVLTTYSVIAADIHYAREPPKRELRQEKVYALPRSPLVTLSWWRVCLDEAQMIESGVSNAATVARLIPRTNAWAVSGTPVKKNVNDLHGLLIFLRYYPFSDIRVWEKMVSSDPADLSELFGQIAMRHSKNAVREELGLPPQKRIVVTVPFTAIEESNYNHQFQQMCDDSGLTTEGAPLRDDWNPNDPSTIEKMRSWLMRLRQTCLHAEIGLRNRRALGRGNGPLRTVNEVLEVLIEQNETSLRAEERSMVLARVMRGHILSFGKRPQEALEIYQAALTEATEAVLACRGAVRAEKENVTAKSSKQMSTKLDSVSASDDETEDDSDERRATLRQCQQRLRSALEVQHVCAFFCGTAYFQVKESLPKIETGDKDDTTMQPEDLERKEILLDLEKKEASSYDLAKGVRRELLTDVAKKTNQFISKLSSISKTSFIQFPYIEDDVELEGIESRQVTEKIAKVYQLLNEQAKKITHWRLELTRLLMMELVDQDEEVEMTGEEYESSTKQQDEQYFYHQALRAGLSDMHALLTGQVNQLIDAEMRSADQLVTFGADNDPTIRGPAPELFEKMLVERTAFNEQFRKLPRFERFKRGGVFSATPFLSARGIMTEIHSLITAVQWQQGVRSNRAQAEVTILQRHLGKLQAVFAARLKALTGLDEELDLFRSTMNQRLEFYRQLQHISDQVAPFQEEASDVVDQQKLAVAEADENKHAIKLAAFKTKSRFLTHLRAESSGKQEQRVCIICQSSFETGVLTVCGHQYCKECIQIWWAQKHTCPMCKRAIKSNEFHEITYKPQELRAQEELQTSSASRITSTAQQQQSSIYTSVSASTLDAIKSVDLPSKASYGTKIDLICRTLLHLRAQDPGSKSIIFSQYRDFLNVLSAAFNAHRIGYSAISDKNGISRFREDASVECFLLHAKADSSGLNLVNATHVFLCEPLINAAIELQAVARVHRIGQMRETTVWMFLVQDTVEEAIYNISVKRRLAHMQRNEKDDKETRGTELSSSELVKEKSLDAANSLEMQATPLSKLLTKDPSGGEVVGKDDLWTCLFGKSKRQGADVAAGGNVGGVVGKEIERFLRADAAAGRAEA